MLKLNLQDIPRVESISKEDFIKHYFKPQKPVVIERFITDWPAFTKWDLDYFKELAGDKMVSLYDDRPVSHQDGFNQPHAKMTLGEYVDLLKSEPTKYRDRKSTRLNSSHVKISYAVFCLKKKKKRERDNGDKDV